MAWTSPYDFTAGQSLTASILDTYLSDNLAALLPVDDIGWTSFNPTLTNITDVNGTESAYYQVIGGLVVVSYRFTLGSSSAMGSGPQVAVPVTPNSRYGPLEPLGPAQFHDSGSTYYFGYVRLTTDRSAFVPLTMDVSGTYPTNVAPSSSIPMTWATGDTLAFTAIYEAA